MGYATPGGSVPDSTLVDGVDKTIANTVYDTTTPTVNSTDNPQATHITNTNSDPIPITGGAGTSRARPRFYKSQTEITLNNTTDTELVNINFDGQVDAISVNFDSEDVEIVLDFDGTEIFRENLKDLADENKYNLSDDDGDKTTDFPIAITSEDDDRSHIFFDWHNTPVDILTNLTIKAKASTSSTTKMKGILIVRREIV